MRGAAAGLAALLVAAPARADDALSRAVDVRVTETAVLDYRFDNRNATRADDHYGEWLNRLNVQATSGRFTAAVRLDSAIFAFRPSPSAIAAKDADAAALTGAPRAAFVGDLTQAYGRDLATRYRDVVYPSKVSLGYTDRGLSVVAGDTYAQLGRGLVLSLRKVDELSVDTTIRGLKADYKGELSGVRVAVTALAGLTNPLRVDEPSGRVLTTASGGRGAYFPLAPRPHAVDPYLPLATATFSPDLVTGAHLSADASGVELGLNAARIARDPSPLGRPFLGGTDAIVTRNARSISLVSASLAAPSIQDHGSVYAELATQTLEDPIAPRETDLESGLPGVPGADPALLRRLSGGYAAYAFATLYDGPFTLSVEGKRYERFFPVAASVDPRAAEVAQLQYNAPPTTETITSDVQLGAFNACVTGGRARLDWRASPAALAYASLGRYATYGERSPTCGQGEAGGGETRALRNDVWDPFVGLELAFDDARSHVFASTGVRFDETPDARAYAGVAPTRVFYREGWLRYDLVKHLSGAYAIELAGVHRYRSEPQSRATPWREGESYTSVFVSPKLSLAVGYEYSTREGTRKDYVSGLVQWRVASDTVVRTFVGQTRPALRCIAGVCRQLPAFEGARVEVVARF